MSLQPINDSIKVCIYAYFAHNYLSVLFTLSDPITKMRRRCHRMVYHTALPSPPLPSPSLPFPPPVVPSPALPPTLTLTLVPPSIPILSPGERRRSHRKHPHGVSQQDWGRSTRSCRCQVRGKCFTLAHHYRTPSHESSRRHLAPISPLPPPPPSLHLYPLFIYI